MHNLIRKEVSQVLRIYQGFLEFIFSFLRRPADPDEIETHDIHVDNVMDVHCTPLFSTRNLIIWQFSKHQAYTMPFCPTRHELASYGIKSPK
jgi:hypothetical protein